MEIVIKVKTNTGNEFEFELDEAIELKEKLVKMLDGETDPDKEEMLLG